METINKLQVRKEKKAILNNSRTLSTKAAAHEQYTVANRAVKKSIKTDKDKFKGTAWQKRLKMLEHEET